MRVLNYQKIGATETLFYTKYHGICVRFQITRQPLVLYCSPNAEDMLKSVVSEEKKFKYSPWARANNPLGPNF